MNELKTISPIKERCLKAMSSYLLTNIKSSARSAEDKGQRYGRKDSLLISISETDIYNLLVEQDFKCAITKIPFILFEKSCYYRKPNEYFNNINRLLIASADRINPSKPYTLQNIQIVLRFINIGKNDYTNDETKEVLELIKNPNEENIIYTKQQTIKTKIMNKSLDSTYADVMEYFLIADKVEACVMLYEKAVRKNLSNVKVKIEKINKNNDKLTPAKKRKEYFDKNTKQLDSVDESFILIQDFIGTSGKNATEKAQTCAAAQKIVDNNVPVYKVKAERNGYKHYFNKLDVENINLK